jgi:hypothetical protein
MGFGYQAMPALDADTKKKPDLSARCKKFGPRQGEAFASE